MNSKCYTASQNFKILALGYVPKNSLPSIIFFTVQKGTYQNFNHSYPCVAGIGGIIVLFLLIEAVPFAR